MIRQTTRGPSLTQTSNTPIFHLASLSFLKSVVIFGGTGFIGTHLTAFLLEHFPGIEIICADLRPFDESRFLPPLIEKSLKTGQVQYIPADVRESLLFCGLPEHVDLIVNLAAICREPGHEHHEYFETNLKGAENVCKWAEHVGCQNILFTSSIAVYGFVENDTDETALPLPRTPYGSSKLAAEILHRCWQERAPGRQLMIVRPGVVYGAGENANVTRLIRAVLKRRFVYTGNRNTRKAGGYVKELCRALLWLFDRQCREKRGFLLANFGQFPLPTVQEYVEAILRTAHRSEQWTPSLPFSLVRGLSVPVARLSRLAGYKSPIDPLRVDKVARSTPVVPGELLRLGYPFRYSLEEAFHDWLGECPSDWNQKKIRMIEGERPLR